MRIPEVTVADVLDVGRRVKRHLDAWRGTKVPGRNCFRFVAPETTLTFHGQGLGDLMIIRQFGRGFETLLEERGDPELGDVVVSCGGYKAAYEPDPGDLNLFWWWSFGPKDDDPAAFLDYYLEEVSVRPDMICCLSEPCLDEARERGFEALHLPLGTQAFRPLGNERSGKGYAGSANHKGSEKERRLLGPHGDDADFEWVTEFVTPTQLNLWYNTRLVTFGLTKEGQRQWGMVNNRVFETLASGTPLVLESHPHVEEILGFDYPYQTSSRRETVALVEDIEANPAETLAEFAEYSETVRREHSYSRRAETLVDALS